MLDQTRNADRSKQGIDDIVSRLRDEWGAHDQTSRDAADEIERLRTRCDTLRAHADRLASELARLHSADYCEDGCAITDALYAWQQTRTETTE